MMRKGGVEAEKRGLAEFEQVLDAEYWPSYNAEYYGRMRQKLGLSAAAAGSGGGADSGEVSDEQKQMIQSFLTTLEATCGDFTNCFRILSSLSLAQTNDNTARIIDYLVSQSSSAATYLASIQPRVDEEQMAYFQHIMAHNPNVRDSSGLIEGEKERKRRRGEVDGLDDTKKQVRDRRLWSEWLDGYRRYSQRLWGSDGGRESERRRGMNSVNAKYVLRSEHTTHHQPIPPLPSPARPGHDADPLRLVPVLLFVHRNWMAQMAIEKAESGDYTECQQLLNVLLDPYAVEEDEVVVREGEEKGRQVESEKGAGRYTCKPPKNYENVLCSCSS